MGERGESMRGKREKGVGNRKAAELLEVTVQRRGREERVKHQKMPGKRKL